jgi:NADH-quinone oxidoreductase subunit J
MIILFSLLIIIQSLLIIYLKDAVISVLFLINVFLVTSLLFLIIGAEFLSILLVIVYVGAVSVLFLFVIMLLNLRIVEIYNTFINYLPLGLFIGIFFFFRVIIYII